jgi:putative endonuclease
MMTNRRHGTLYIGVTADLVTRVVQHRDGEIPGFTATYGLKRLVWYEPHESIVAAIQREKSIKKYRREWKLNLIERENPGWEDLLGELI